MKNKKSRFKSDTEAERFAKLMLSPVAVDTMRVLYAEFIAHDTFNKSEEQKREGKPELALRDLLDYSKGLKKIVLNPSGMHIAMTIFNQENA